MEVVQTVALNPQIIIQSPDSPILFLLGNRDETRLRGFKGSRGFGGLGVRGQIINSILGAQWGD